MATIPPDRKAPPVTRTSIASTIHRRFSPVNGGRVRGVRRLFVLIGAVGLVCSVSGNAFAKAPAQPKITATAATFNVPGGSTAVWTLRLWSHGTLEGKDTGTSGTLTVPVPVTADCFFQADVQATTVKGLPFYFSGSRATVPGCGVGPPVGEVKRPQRAGSIADHHRGDRRDPGRHARRGDVTAQPDHTHRRHGR